MTNLEEVRRTWELLVPKGEVSEIRILGVVKGKYQSNWSGFFDNANDVCTELKRLNGSTPHGVYITPQQLHHGLLSRRQNRLDEAKRDFKSTSDKDIAGLRYFLVDIDPERPSGISASKEEKGAATDKVREIVLGMRKEGWPDPVIGDSGNGAHLIWRIDLKPDDSELLQTCLKALDFKFAGGAARVDPTTYNPSRIWKLYGTVARKGDNTEERPHRQARLIKVPDNWERVKKWQLEDLARKAPPDAYGKTTKAANKLKGKVTKWLEDGEADFDGPFPYGNDDQKWVLNVCPMDGAHTDRPGVVIQFGNGNLFAKCSHESCKWGIAELEEKYGPIVGGKAKKKKIDQGYSIVMKYGLTDDGNATRLIDAFEDEIAYIKERNLFIIWNGQVWEEDPLNCLLGSYARVIGDMLVEKARREDYSDSASKILKWAEKSKSSRAISAMMKLATMDERIHVCTEDLDADPFILNVQNGTIDLRTRKFKKHDRADMLTKIAGVEYDPDADCPRFKELLSKLMKDDSEMVHYMQQSFGYFLTGSTEEEKLFFWVGTGANGKSTLVTLLRRTAGSYYTAAPSGILIQRKGDSHPTAQATVVGARVAVISEVPRGGAFEEEKLKQMVSREEQVVRHMRENYFSFIPTHKPLLMSNHRPYIRGNDEGMWRRMNVVPFEVTIPVEERNPDLADEIWEEESSGILNFMLDGSQDWYKNGLITPKKVQIETKQYREEEDDLAEFIDFRCELGGIYVQSTQMLYDSYLDWCEETKERPMIKSLFGRKLAERNLKPCRIRKVRGWRGIKLTSEASDYLMRQRSAGQGVH